MTTEQLTLPRSPPISPTPSTRPLVISLVTLLTGVALWGVGVSRIKLGRMNDFGLVSVMPIEVVGALLLVTLSFVITITMARARPILVLLDLAVLVVMLYGLFAFAATEPTGEVTWRHIGIVDYVRRHGTTNPQIDAYFNWPGFFVVAATAVKLLGADSAIIFVRWASVVLNVLYLGPLIMIFRSLTSDRRLIWASVWVFLITDWIGQDYFSPQGFTYFTYLTVLALMLTYLSSSTRPRPAWISRIPFLSPWGEAQSARQPPVPQNISRRQRGFLVGTVAVMSLATVPEHQLTPLAILLAMTTLVVVRRFDAWGLPLLLATGIAAWSMFPASEYFAGHLSVLANEIGLGTAVSANVGGRLQGSHDHTLVVDFRLLYTLIIWAVASFGVLRRMRSGHWDLSAIALTIAPFILIVLTPYGGEMVLRVYYFSLPFVAFFCAAALLPSASSSRTLGATRLFVVLLLLIGGFQVARYGNAAYDYFTPQEVAAIRHMYAVAPPGSLLVAESPDLPWKYRDYENHKYALVGTNIWQTGVTIKPFNLRALIRSVTTLINQNRRRGVYVIVTRSQSIYLHAAGNTPPGSLDRFARALERQRGVKLVFHNSGGWVFTSGAEGATGG